MKTALVIPFKNNYFSTKYIQNKELLFVYTLKRLLKFKNSLDHIIICSSDDDVSKALINTHIKNN